MSVTPATWLRYLPVSLRARIEHRHNLQEILVNIGWLFGDKLLRMGVGLLVGVWVARYLGPEQFGLMSYAMAIVALVSSAGSLGLNGIVVRDIVMEPDTADVTLGTAFLLQIIGGFLAFVLGLIAISIARPDDDLARFMVAVLGFVMVFKAAEVVKYWFESQVKSKYTIWVENAVFLVLAAVRVGLILAQASLLAFVWATFAEAALVAVFLLLLYAKKVGTLPFRSASVLRAKHLLMESWPLILVSFASFINMRMDQVMLGAMTNDLVVGNYSAAVRISEVWLMIPGILGASIFPAIIAAKEKSEVMYRKRILQISSYMAMVVLLVALVISTGANQITYLLYGKQYASAGGYLAILIWSGVPYLIFFAFNQMYYIEKLVRISFYVAAFAVTSNISLNLALIPVYGGTGAAVATLITAFGSTAVSLTILNVKTGIFWGVAREKG